MDRLQTVDDLPQLMGLEVPPGKYISTRLGKPRRQEDTIVAGPSSQGSDPLTHDALRPTNMAALRTYAPFPMPYQVTPPVPSPGSHQQAYDQRQQYYNQVPPPVSEYDYPQQQRFGRPTHALPDAHRQFYGAYLVPVRSLCH